MASLAIEGISRTQGPHHVAQKLRKTVLPLNFEKGTGWSCRSRSDQLIFGRLAHAGVFERAPLDRHEEIRQNIQKSAKPMARDHQIRLGLEIGSDIAVIIASSLRDGTEQIIHGSVIVGQDDIPGPNRDRLFVFGPVRFGFGSRSLGVKLGVVGAASPGPSDPAASWRRRPRTFRASPVRVRCRCRRYRYAET